MSIETAENTTVHLTASEHLSDLQARAINGEPVAASDLAEARAAVELEGLQTEGRSRRDRAQAEKAAEKAQADAKGEAARIVGEVNPVTVLAAFDDAVAALEKLHETVEGYNGTVQRIGDLYEAAGVLSRSSLSSERENDPNKTLVDPQNYATPSLIGGGEFTSVKVDGTVYGRLGASLWLGHALNRVAKENHGLPVPHEASIASRLNLSRPFDNVLAEHLSR
nr:hypothetical protein [Rhodococcus sp. (in: high G+C Gram-positive bacteria)]